jgi:thiamine-phosphate pyrophosphorylase
MLDFAAACFDGGATFLQIRGKTTPARTLLETAQAIVSRARATGALVIINDRADLARLADAGGVHIGQEDLTPRAVRAIVGPSTIIGLSTHTADQCARALQEPIDYVAVGPVFSTRTKATGYQPIGVAAVRRTAEQIAAAANSSRPLVAIGGLTLDNARSVIEAGAASVAVISDLLTTGNPTRRVEQFLDALDESPPSSKSTFP